METEQSEFRGSSETLKCQTWVLKICIDCEGCRKKVKRVLQAIEGVYTTKIDDQQHKVTVTGNVSAEALIKKLAKSGKRAELLPENIQKISKNSTKGKEQDKKNFDDHQDGDKKKEGEDKSAENPENALEDGRNGTAEAGQKELPVVANDTNSEVHETGEKKKKKKKKKVPTGDSVATDGPSGVRLPPPKAAASVLVLPAPPVDLSRTNVPFNQNPTVYGYVNPELGASYSRATYAAPADSYYAAPMPEISCAHPVVTIPQYDPFIAKDNGNDDDDDYYSCSIM